jgi:flagellar hook-associated protein 2
MVSSVNGASIVKNLTGGTIDISELAKNLTEATRAPEQAIIDQKTQAANAKISSIGKIQSIAKAFKDALASFGDARSLPLSPTTSDATAAEFSFKSFFAPSAIDFAFKVTQLATENRASFTNLTSTGSFNLNGTAITYTSLTDLKDKIALQTGFTATILNGKDIIVSKGFGAANQFSANGTSTQDVSTGAATLRNIASSGSLTLPDNTSITYTSLSDLITQLGNASPAITATQVANTSNLTLSTTASAGASISFTRSITTTGTDAIVEADGQTYLSSSNRFSNLITGVNIDVKRTTTDEVRISTTRNTDQFITALRTIVDGYNTLRETITNEVKFDTDINKRGGLSNDPVTRTFMNQMRRITTDPIINYGGQTRTLTLADAGVVTNRDGSLSLDTNKIDKLVQNSPDVLEAVISTDSTSTGSLDRMKSLTDTILGSSSMFQQLYNKTKNTELTKLQDEAAKLDERMTALQERYISQFTTMQSIVTQSQKTQSSLTDFMTSWSASLKG